MTTMLPQIPTLPWKMRSTLEIRANLQRVLRSPAFALLLIARTKS